MKFETREQWLMGAADTMRKDLFLRNDETVPTVKISVGFPGGGNARKRIGECWDPEASEDKISQVFISPILDDSVRVLDVLAHELIHAIYPKAGHKGPFKRVAKKIGLTGKMTATVAGPELEKELKKMASKLGHYPHSKLNLNDRKKQKTRNLKCICQDCGYTARTANKWLELLGAPICPCNDEQMAIV